MQGRVELEALRAKVVAASEEWSDEEDPVRKAREAYEAAFARRLERAEAMEDAIREYGDKLNEVVVCEMCEGVRSAGVPNGAVLPAGFKEDGSTSMYAKYAAWYKEGREDDAYDSDGKPDRDSDSWEGWKYLQKQLIRGRAWSEYRDRRGMGDDEDSLNDEVSEN